MSWIDWLVVAAFLVGISIVGVLFSKRASKNLSEYFVGGRSVPWYLAGTSMLATSFASDTPLHVTRALREGGLPRAWFYWEGIIGGVLVALVFSRLWRRARVLTDNELIEIRYTGKPAAVLRGGLAIFKCFFLEILTMAWITLGMTKIVTTILGLPPTFALLGLDVPTNAVVVSGLICAALAFSVTSGFWGVVVTDTVEFVVAMTGAVVLAIISMIKVGGPTGLREGLTRLSPMKEHALDFTPDFSATDTLGLVSFGIYLGVQWWARHESDGSGQRAQRFSACKSEGEAIAAGIWNLSVQWLIRSWPWYLTALASTVLYPAIADHETVYPLMVHDLLPVGLKGLMVASFFAAFMGTMESHYNMTASYALNDVYKRFVAKKKDQKHYVRVSRLLTAFIATLAGVVALLLPSVMGAFRFKIELVAGIGLILVLRWLWWRVTAITELTALGTSVVTALTLNVVLVAPAGQEANYFALRTLIVVSTSALLAVLVTIVTRPEPKEHLLAFYRRVRPPKLLWGPIAAEAGDVGPTGLGWNTIAQAVLAFIFVCGGMLSLGKLLLGEPVQGVILLAISATSGVVGLRWLFKESQAASQASAAQEARAHEAGTS